MIGPGDHESLMTAVIVTSTLSHFKPVLKTPGSLNAMVLRADGDIPPTGVGVLYESVTTTHPTAPAPARRPWPSSHGCCPWSVG